MTGPLECPDSCLPGRAVVSFFQPCCFVRRFPVEHFPVPLFRFDVQCTPAAELSPLHTHCSMGPTDLGGIGRQS